MSIHPYSNHSTRQGGGEKWGCFSLIEIVLLQSCGEKNAQRLGWKLKPKVPSSCARTIYIKGGVQSHRFLPCPCWSVISYREGQVEQHYCSTLSRKIPWGRVNPTMKKEMAPCHLQAMDGLCMACSHANPLQNLGFVAPSGNPTSKPNTQSELLPQKKKKKTHQWDV